MVVYYQLAGKQVGSHVLAMGVLGSLFGGVYLATRGGSQPKQAAPPIQASSKDEETFIHRPNLASPTESPDPAVVVAARKILSILSLLIRTSTDPSRQLHSAVATMKPLPFPVALNIGTDIVHLPRITRLLHRGDYLTRFTRRILHDHEQRDFRTRFALPATMNPPNPRANPNPNTTDMARWLAGRFAAKEAARKAAPNGAASLGWKDVMVRVSETDTGRPEIVYLDGETPRIGKLSISHDGEYVIATVLAAGHSGQFCPGHAKDSLEEVIQLAIAKKFQVFCLTEHMPRCQEDFYPEEIEAGNTETGLVANEAAYFQEAQRLREKYADQIKILIGFEIDWIRPESRTLIEASLARHPFEFFMGSVHHTLTIPIDYDRDMYVQARDLAGGTDEQLFQVYFDEQYEMLRQLKPLVVGHFDLIRLKSDDPERSFTQWPAVWERILRNLDFVASYGGLLELNSAALRKGMSEPYPKAEICKEFLARGGRFCLSDDSHGLDQVGLNFHRVLAFVEAVGISTLHYLDLADEPAVDDRFPRTQIRSISLEEMKTLAFWQ
ncbi:hypothetical protein APSETT445_008290 [Aspergillus pseudonomiae]